MKFKKFKLNLQDKDLMYYNHLFDTDNYGTKEIRLETLDIDNITTISDIKPFKLKSDLNLTVFDKKTYKEYINIDNTNKVIYDNIYISDNYIPIDIIYNIKNLTELKNNNYKYHDSSCWWCCYDLDDNTIPVPLPIIYIEKDKYHPVQKFKCKGIFCSFNCASSYNSLYHKSNSSYLLNYLYKKCCKKNCGYIKNAPPKEVLQKFGGIYSIEEYRQNFISLNIIDIYDYPVIFKPRTIHEKQYEYDNSKLSNYDKNINKSITNNKKLQESYKVANDKKLQESNKITNDKKYSENKKNDIKKPSNILDLLNIKVITS